MSVNGKRVAFNTTFIQFKIMFWVTISKSNSRLRVKIMSVLLHTQQAGFCRKLKYVNLFILILSSSLKQRDLNYVKKSMHWSQQTPSSNNTREDSTHGHHQMVNTEVRLITFFAAKDGEALYSQQKQDQELTVAQIMNSLLANSDLN